MNSTTSRRKQMYTSKKLLFLLGLTVSGGASAYQQQQQVMFPPSVTGGAVWGKHRSSSLQHAPASPLKYNQDDRQQSTAPPTRAASKYDLGLGKNLPVMMTKPALAATAASSGDETHFQHDDIHQAVEYLVEHDAAMEYPSPDAVRQHKERLLHADASAPVQSKAAMRLPAPAASEATIYYAPKQDRQLSVAPHMDHFVVDRAATSGLDLNTAWVELLMLEQQKLAAATATS